MTHQHINLKKKKIYIYILILTKFKTNKNIIKNQKWKGEFSVSCSFLLNQILLLFSSMEIIITPYQTYWSKPQIINLHPQQHKQQNLRKFQTKIHHTHWFTESKYIWNQNPKQSTCTQQHQILTTKSKSPNPREKRRRRRRRRKWINHSRKPPLSVVAFVVCCGSAVANLDAK